MNLVPNIERCKKLRDLGYPQGESYFVWRAWESNWKLMLRQGLVFYEYTPKSIAAPLASELGEWLPERVAVSRYGDEWACYKSTPADDQRADTMPNVMADMGIWLLENGYMK